MNNILGLKRPYCFMALAVAFTFRVSEPAGFAETATGQATPAKKNLPLTDQYGDALPEGAVARLGAMRFRHEGGAHSLVYAPDGKTLAAHTDSGVMLWDADTGAIRHRLPVRMSWPRGIAFSPDGTLLAVTESSPGEKTRISLWERQTGKRIRTLAPGQQLNYRDCCFTPDGASLAMGSAGHKAVVLDLKSGQVRATLGVKGLAIYRIAVAPDGKTLAAAVQDIGLTPRDGQQQHSVQIWDIASGNLLRTIHEQPASPPGETIVTALTFAPDGKVLAAGSQHRVFLLDPLTGQVLGRLEDKMGQPRGLAFTPDGSQLVTAGTADGTVRLWRVADGKIVRAFQGLADWSASLALAPDGRTVALGSSCTIVQLWDVVTGKELFREFKSPATLIQSLAYAPDGKTLAAAGTYTKLDAGGETLLWDTTTRRLIGTLAGSGRALAFAADGSKLARIEGPPYDFTNSLTTKVQIWDLPGLASDKPATVITVPNSLKSVYFSSDHTRLVTLERNHAPESIGIRHWLVSSGKQERHWTLPTNESQSGAYSMPVAMLASSGRKVFEALSDGDFSIWDVESGRRRWRRGRAEEGDWTLMPSGDGKALALWRVERRSADGRAPRVSPIRFLEVATGREISRASGHQGQVTAVTWSPRGRLAASGDRSGDPDHPDRTPSVAQTIRLWDSATGKELARFGGFHADVCVLAFAPDGASLAAGLRDGTTLIFDMTRADPTLLQAPKLARDALEACWSDLQDDNVGKAHQALWMLVGAPKQAVPLLRERLEPAPRIDEAKVQKWLADLDSDNFSVRQASAREIKNAGDKVALPIRKALNGSISLEARRRLQQLLESLAETQSPETVRALRAIMVLERIGSRESRDVLEALARGAPGARQTEEAQAALEER